MISKSLNKFVSEHNERFIGNSQEDAADFLSELICAIGIDLKTKRENLQIEGQEYIEERRKLLQENGIEEWFKTLNQSIEEIKLIQRNGSSDLMDLFRSQIYSETECNECGFKETFYEDRILMEIDLKEEEKKTDLIKCFQRTFEKENLGLDNDNICEKCDKVTSFTRKEWILRLPKILIIQLKRFRTNDFGEEERDNKSVEFPLIDLDASLMVHNYFQGLNKSYLYNLYGISNHFGTLHGGHYTANIKNIAGDGSWYKCDDERTEVISAPETSGSSPYVLFYCREDVVDNIE